MLTLGVLCSGSLGKTTLVKILENFTVKFILTDSKSDEIIRIAKSFDIPIYIGNPRNGRGYDFIKRFNVDVITSINYLFLIENDIIDHANLLAFNIHGSLLPKYRGRTPHVWAIINGENKTGITAHVIDSGCDTGDIIHQKEILIEPEDTGGIILEKYSNEYYPLIQMVLNDVKNDELKFSVQNENEASYFEKRTPEDGEINWEWSKEDIKNWVRAQAFPYPGAFAFYDDKKIIIDKVSTIDCFVDDGKCNGEIIKVEPDILVKTANGLIRLDKIRTENCNFVIGNKLENKNENRK